MARRHPPTSVPFLRRRSNLWLVGALVLLAIAAILGAISRNGSGPHRALDSTATIVTATSATPTLPLDTPVSSAVPAGPTVTVVTPGLHVEPSQLQSARVVHVVDGDTIDVEIDGQKERVRYYGIDTPERGDACFSEATARNDELIDGSVLLLPDARNRDRYGRLLRYIFDANGNSVDERLIAEGLAHAWRQDGAYRDQLIALEDQTDAAKIGCLWE
jgi:endonuclease YncB( thermonuclease family)